MNEKSLKVLEEYDLELISARRGRGSYICETSLGTKLLADYNGSEKKAAFTSQLLQHMEEKGYQPVDKAVANKEGRLLCRDRDEQSYILKDWYEGRECDTKNNTDVRQAVSSLARLHGYMVWKPEEKTEYAGEDLQDIWRRHNRELKKIYEFIRKRKQKTGFESLFLKEYDRFAQQAKAAAWELEQSGYEELYQNSLKMGQLCHGNYNQHNVYFLGRRQIFTANFEKCGYDIQINDLYQFVRKIMEKQEWSPQTGDQMLDAYSRERPLADREVAYLKIRLSYPEKFWKVANQYYNCRKSCASWKSMEKLEKLTFQEEKRRIFLGFL